MLQSSFLFIAGIGKNTEQKLWKEGIFTWDDYSENPRSISGVPSPDVMIRSLNEARENIKNINYFAQRIPRAEYWRLYHPFQDECMYLDIETNGLYRGQNSITVIGVMYRDELMTHIRHKNLSEFRHILNQPKVSVTFNGIRFDVPFIEYELSLNIPQIQIDLMNVFRSLGIRGGLKKIEAELGISRGNLSSLTGFDAIKLWQIFQDNSDQRALDTLLAYNAEDVINLKSLMVKAFNMKLDEIIVTNRLNMEKHLSDAACERWLRIWNSFRLPDAMLISNPFTADDSTLRSLASQ